MNKFLSFVLGLLFCTLSFAQQSQTIPEKSFFQMEKIGVHLVSHHFPNTGELDVNPGMYMEFRLGNVSGLTMGAYRNSVRKDSVYFGKNWQLFSAYGFSGSVMTGIISGYPTGSHYDVKGNEVLEFKQFFVPIVAPTLSYAVTQHTAIRLTVVPRFRKYNRTTVLHLSAEYTF